MKVSLLTLAVATFVAADAPAGPVQAEYVRGEVRLQNGKVVAKAEVRLLAPGKQRIAAAITDRRGAFAILVPTSATPADCSLSVSGATLERETSPGHFELVDTSVSFAPVRDANLIVVPNDFVAAPPRKRIRDRKQTPN